MEITELFEAYYSVDLLDSIYNIIDISNNTYTYLINIDNIQTFYIFLKKNIDIPNSVEVYENLNLNFNNDSDDDIYNDLDN